MLDYLIFAVTVVIFLIITVVYLYPGSKKLTTIPGPEPIDPLEGNFPDIKSSGSLNEFLEEIHKTYGSIASFWAGPQLCVSVASPSLFKQHSHLFDRPGELFKAAALLWSENSLFMLNGQEGRKKHSFIKNCLNEDFIKIFLANNSKLLSQQMKTWASLPTEQYFPLYEKASSHVIKSVVESVLGFETKQESELNYLKGNLENMLLEVEHYIHDVQDVDGRREKRLNKYKENILEFISRALESRKSNSSVGNKNLPVDKMLEMTEEEALNDLLVLICDAYFKSSSFLTWFGYFLALDQDVQDKVRKEFSSVDANELTPEDISGFKYLQLVIKEVLRLANIVPYTARCQNVDSELDTHKIPAGTPVLHALGVVSNDSAIFENPEEFNPDRFKDTKSSACHPFGFAGQRTCPGLQMATAEVASFYAHMLGSYALELVPNQLATPHHGFYVKPKEEIWLTLKARFL